MKWIERGSKRRQRQVTVYKRMIIFGVVTLSLIMIALPTVIVMLPQNTSVAYEAEELVMAFSEKETAASTFEVSIKRSDTGEVESVPLEEYVESVVASEMPADFAEEALKAQAIAARTYIVHFLLQQTNGTDTVISDTTEHQVYKSTSELKSAWGEEYHWKSEKIKRAVSATEGEIITYNEAPITPTFFSMSNGYTENAEDYWGTALPYLKKVESSWEKDLPNFSEQLVFTMDEVNEKLSLQLEKGKIIPIKITRTSSERVKEISINEVSLTGKEVRENLGLRSNDFTVIQKDDHFIFTTKGYGHGVGMSQYGANAMAEAGDSYRDILLYYYQDVEIEQISDVTPVLLLN